MSDLVPEGIEICPDCGEELWYDAAEGCWVCENCGGEFGEADWEEEEEEEGEAG